MPDERIPLTPGLKVTQIAKEGSPVRGMYIMGENPIISDPDVSHAETWFRELEFLAVQDLFLTETARYADVVLPGASFAEKEGTYREHGASDPALQGGGRSAGGGAGRPRDRDRPVEPDRTADPFTNAAEVMDEIARVTPLAGCVARQLAGSGAAVSRAHSEHPGTAFLFDDQLPDGGRAGSFVPVEFLPPAELPDEEYPFMLNTGRQMYHWHTGTMTRRSFALDAREPVPTVEIHAADAEVLGVHDGDTVRVTSRRGTVRIGVRVCDVRPADRCSSPCTIVKLP